MTNKNSIKTEILNLRLTPEEKEVLETIADMSNTSQGDLIRGIISVAAQLVAVDKAAGLVDKNKSLQDYLNQFQGVRPYDVARVMVMLGQMAADHGRMDAYDQLAELAYGKTATMTPGVLKPIRRRTRTATA